MRRGINRLSATYLVINSPLMAAAVPLCKLLDPLGVYGVSNQKRGEKVDYTGLRGNKWLAGEWQLNVPGSHNGGAPRPFPVRG